MRLVVVALLVLLQDPSYPPAYPRPGAVRLLENDRVVVWNISWLKQQYPVHRHRYALAGVYYAPGDRMIVSLDGTRRPVSTKAGDTAFQRAGVTHIEEGTSDQPLRAVFFEMKEPEASGVKDVRTSPPAFPGNGAVPFIENDRVVGWLYEPSAGNAGSAHRHVYDAVVVWLDGDTPHVQYTPHGTVHSDEGIGRATRAWIWEVK
jgi:hypothetical protein